MRRLFPRLLTRKPRLNDRNRNRLRPGVESLEGRQLLATSITEFPIPGWTAGSRAASGVIASADGNLWFAAEKNTGTAEVSEFVRTTTAGVSSVFTLPAGSYFPYVGVGLTVGADGNLWFPATNQNMYAPANLIGRISPTGAITEFPIPSATVSVLWPDLTAGPDGSLWFSTNTGSIGRITTSGVVSIFPTAPTTVSQQLGPLTVGPDGNLWFNEIFYHITYLQFGAFNSFYDGSKVGRVTPSGVVTEFPTPTLEPYTEPMIVGGDGNLWYNEGPNLERVSPSGAVADIKVFPSSGFAGGFLNGAMRLPNGDLWFDSSLGFFQVTPSDTISKLNVFERLPLTVGPDGNLWINQFASITPDGVVNSPDLASLTYPVTLGSDGNLWFVTSTGHIGRVLFDTNVINAAVNPVSAEANAAFRGPVATFTTASTTASAADFQAEINYGDGQTAPGVITLGPARVFTVSGAHTYAKTGKFPVSVTITSVTRGHATATGQAIVSAPPSVTGHQLANPAKGPTQVVLTFSRPMDASSVQNVNNYTLYPVSRSGVPLPFAKPVPIASAVYDRVKQTVTLTLGVRLSLTGYYLLSVNGTSAGRLTDVNGVPLVGTGSSTPGSDALAILHG